MRLYNSKMHVPKRTFFSWKSLVLSYTTLYFGIQQAFEKVQKSMKMFNRSSEI